MDYVAICISKFYSILSINTHHKLKPGVKLPVTVKIDGKNVPMTILEAVIKQTGCYANSRPGRLSVFWGDQIFIPTVNVEYTVAYHVDILCSLGPMPSAQEWIEKGTKISIFT